MLRGSCSCAISELATPSSFVSPSLLRPLTPLFPLDASHSPITPLFPLHTQKQGGRGVSCVASFASLTSFASFTSSLCMTNRSISESSPARSSAAPHFSAFPLRSPVHSAPPCPALRGVRHPFFHHCLSALHGASSLFSGPSSSNRQISAESARSINITLRLSIILSNIVGVPTFLSRDRTTKDQQLIDPGTVFSSHCGLSTMNCFSPLTPIIPAHTRRSPVSPIIPALTQNMGGGGVSWKKCSRVTLLFSYAALTIQLSTIVGAPTFMFLHAAQSLHVQENSREKERSLDYATRRARLRRGGENRVAPLGMTAKRGKRKASECRGQGIVRTWGAGVLRPYTSKRNPGNRPEGRPLHEQPQEHRRPPRKTIWGAKSAPQKAATT